MPYSLAPPGRIDSTQRQFGFRRPAHRTALSETSVVLREQMSGLRVGVDPRDLLGQPPRSCSLLFAHSDLTTARVRRSRAKKNKICHTSYQRPRCRVARGAPRSLALIGRCYTSHRTRQTSQPGSRRHWISSPHATTIRKVAARRDIPGFRPRTRLASSLTPLQELSLSRLPTPPGAPLS